MLSPLRRAGSGATRSADDRPAHPYVGLDYYNLGISLFEQERYEDALPHFRRAITYRKRADKPHQSILFDAYLKLGRCRTALGHYARAESAIDTAAVLERRHRARGTPGYGPVDRRAVLEAFVELYENRGAPEQADRYRRRLANVAPDSAEASP